MHTSLYEVFESTVSRHPGRTAIVEGDTTLTYAQLADQVTRLAAQLANLGVSRGDRVVISCGNRVETVVSFWATLAAGGVSVVINHEQGIQKIRYILHDSAATALVATTAILGRLTEDGLPSTISGVVPIGDTAASPGVEAMPLPDTAPGTVPTPTISEDLAALIYTSGSTGDAKGVMLSHANMLYALTSLNEYLDNDGDDVFLCVLPLSFDYGLYQMIMAFAVGGKLVLERDLSLPLQAFRDIERYRCTVIPGVPVFFELLDQYSRFGVPDVSSVRCLTNTGAALQPSHIDAIKRMFPGASIYSMYGVTECKRCTFLPPHLIDEKPHSVGIAIPNTEVMVLDENDQPCAPYQVGEVVVRGGTVMQGYWRRPEETTEKIRTHPIRGGRCLYTGDYGYLDEDGFLYFKGRMDDVVKVRGRKLIPKDVEDVLRSVAGVRDAAVVCTALDDGNHHIAAFVEADARSVDESDLRAACRSELETYQIPHRFEVLDRLPRNANGKSDKLALVAGNPAPDAVNGPIQVGS